MPASCPGSDLTITIVHCPKCGSEVELFTGDAKAKCPGCGIWVPRAVASCIEWCPGASQCFRHVFEEEEAAAEKKAAEIAEKKAAENAGKGTGE